MEAAELVRSLCVEAGDTFELIEYERLSPLAIEAGALGCYSKIEAGDCVVAFSRSDIFAIRRAVERLTNVREQMPPRSLLSAMKNRLLG